MLRSLSVATLLLGLSASTAHAEELELKNDGFVDSGQATCQQGFATGDEGGVTFSHDADYQLARVQFLFCGADTTETVTVVIYRDTGGAVPGQVLFQGDYPVQGSAEALTEINLLAENLTFSAGESFRFAVRLQHDGAPGLANDTDGTTTPGVNWIYDTLSGSWSESSALGVNGDWIVRAVVDTLPGGAGGNGSMPAATTTSSTAAGAGGGGGAGGAAGDDSPDDEESCSCRLAGGSSAPLHGGWAALAALFWARRRRR